MVGVGIVFSVAVGVGVVFGIIIDLKIFMFCPVSFFCRWWVCPMGFVTGVCVLFFVCCPNVALSYTQ